jgi:hypothetical protein
MRLEEEWLINQNQNIAKESEQILTLSLQESMGKGPFLYSQEAQEAYGRAGIALHLMQLSEHLHFTPKPLTKFEHKLLVSVIHQQLIFMYELEELDLDLLSIHNAPDPVAEELADELEGYYAIQ